MRLVLCLVFVTCSRAPSTSAPDDLSTGEPPVDSAPNDGPIGVTSCERAVQPAASFASACAPNSATLLAPVAQGDIVSFAADLETTLPNAPPISDFVLIPGGGRALVGLRHVKDGRALAVSTFSGLGELAQVRRLKTGDGLQHIIALSLDVSRRILYALNQDGDANARVLAYALDETFAPVGDPRSLAFAGEAMAIARHPTLPILYVSTYAPNTLLVVALDAAGMPLSAATSLELGDGNAKVHLAVHPSGSRLYAGTTGAAKTGALEVLTLVDGQIDALETSVAFAAPARFINANPDVDYHFGALNFALGAHGIYRQQDPRPSPGSTSWPVQSWELDYVKIDDDGAIASPVIHRTDVKHSWLLTQGDRLVYAEPVVATGRIDYLQAGALETVPALTSVIGTRLGDVAIDADGGVTAATQELAYHSHRAVWQLAENGTIGVPLSPLSYWQDEPTTALDERNDPIIMVTPSAEAPSGGADFGTATLEVYMPGDNGIAYTESLPVSDFVTPLALSLRRVGEGLLHAPLDHTQVARSLWLSLPPSVCARSVSMQVQWSYNDLHASQSVTETRTVTSQGCQAVVLIDDNHLHTTEEYIARYAPSLPAVAAQPKQSLVSCYSAIGSRGGIAELDATLALLRDVGCNLVDVDASYDVPAQTLQSRLDHFGFTGRSVAMYQPADAYFSFDPKLAPAPLASWLDQFVFAPFDSIGGRLGDLRFAYLADEPGWYYPRELDNVAANYLVAFHDFLRSRGQTPESLGAGAWAEVLPLAREDATSLPLRRRYYFTQRFFAESASAGMHLAKQAIEKVAGHPVLTPINFNNWRSYAAPGFGSFDWFHSGRTSAHSLFTEDWFGDWQSSAWIYRASMLQSAASLGTEAFGGLVIPATSGEIEDGTSYRTLSLFGRGAKMVSYFTYGPEPFFPGNCWSPNSLVYPELQKANRRVAFADELFATGSAPAVKVFLHTPQEAALWVDAPPSQSDIEGLSELIAHTGRTFTVVDDQAIVDGRLPTDAVLFVSSPNVGQAARAALAQWIARGGRVLAAPDALTRDEFNEPTPPLVASGCGSVTQFTEAKGLRYLAPATATSRRELTSNHAASVREEIAALLPMGSVQVNVPFVEPLRLDGPAGTVVTLLNWSNDTYPCMEVLVRGAAKLPRVSYSEGDVSVRRIGDDAYVSVSLGRVGVIRMEP